MRETVRVDQQPPRSLQHVDVVAVDDPRQASTVRSDSRYQWLGGVAPLLGCARTCSRCEERRRPSSAQRQEYSASGCPAPSAGLFPFSSAKTSRTARSPLSVVRRNNTPILTLWSIR